MAVKGRGRSEMCVVHHDRPAVTRCGSCHKPICDECIISTSDGKFCSRECAARTADFRKQHGKGVAGTNKLKRNLKTVGFILLVIIALALVNRFVFRIPVIGGVLRAIPIVGGGAKETDQKIKDAVGGAVDKAQGEADDASE